MAVAWLLVGVWTVVIFWGSGGEAPSEPVTRPLAEPIVEPIADSISAARGSPLEGPGYDKLDHASEYALLGGLLWLALALTARRDQAPEWLSRWERGWPIARSGPEPELDETEGQKSKRRVPAPLARLLPPLVMAAAVLASLYGATDELHQYFVAERTADGVDWMADSVGGLLGAVAGAVVATRTGRALRRRGWLDRLPGARHPQAESRD